MVEKRANYIDVMRGIGILLVCLGHSIGVNEIPANQFILSFHMPLFFFVSGLCFNYKKDIKTFMKSKIKNLLFPQIFLGILNCFFYIVIDILLKKEKLEKVILFRSFCGWFLITLFFTLTIIYLSFKFIPKKQVILLLLLVSLVLFFVVNYKKFFILQTLTGIFFAVIGYACRPLLDRYVLNEEKFYFSGFGFLLLLIVFVLSRLNKPIAICMNQYGNKFLYIITALIGTFAIADISKSLQNNKALIWFGKNSIMIFVTQSFVIRLLFMTIRYIGRFFSISYSSQYIIVFIFTVIFEIPIVLFLKKYFGFVFKGR